MSKVYDRSYDLINGNQLTIGTAGHAYLLKVPFFAEGFLNKVLVRQVPAGSGGGTSAAFTVDVLNSGLGLTPGDIDPATLPSSWVQRRVLAQQPVLAGAQVSIFIPSGQPFRNQDGVNSVAPNANLYAGVTAPAATSVAGSSTNAPRFIYVLIQAAGAPDATQWEVALAGYSDVGGQ